MAHRTLIPALRALVLSAALCAGAAAADGGDYESTVTQVDPNSGPPFYGVEMSPVPTNVQEREGLTPNQGVYVQNVFPNTAASSNGTKPGDGITSINGAPIGIMTDLRNEVGLNQVGEAVTVTVRRNGQDITLSSPLQEWPKNIPRERIDPESERRFRQWQQDRLSQQRKQVQELKDKLAKLEQGARPAPDAAQIARIKELEGQLAGKQWQLAWTLQHIDRDPVVAVAEPAAGEVADVTPVRIAWSNARSAGAAQ
jgi:membrane-associated protease RseP (regulator of RpoE activity)